MAACSRRARAAGHRAAPCLRVRLPAPACRRSVAACASSTGSSSSTRSAAGRARTGSATRRRRTRRTRSRAGGSSRPGLEVRVDEAGKHVRRRPIAVWTGSHLDTVPQGGKFDGALGVVAAIEAVERAGRGTVAIFREEERGCVGSQRALVERGALPEAFLELHIEQGPRLAAADAPLGIVTGDRRLRPRRGRRSRARPGTPGRRRWSCATTRSSRRPRSIAAAARRRRRRSRTPCSTVGQIEAEPGGINVIPGRVRYSVDVRAPDQERLDRLIELTGIDGSTARAADRDEPA